MKSVSTQTSTTRSAKPANRTNNTSRMAVAMWVFCSIILGLLASSVFAGERLSDSSTTQDTEVSEPQSESTVQGAVQDDPHDERVLITIPKAKLVLIDDVSVATRDGGIVTSVEVAEGDPVDEAASILELDRPLFEAELDSAIRQREIAEKESENEVDRQYAEKSAKVNEQVLARAQQATNDYARSISKTEIERLKLEYERALLSREQALHTRAVNELTTELRRAQENLARLRLDYRDVRSPISGTVADVYVQRGEYVSPGQPVARIIRTDRLKVEAYVRSELVFELEQGLKAEFVFDLEDQTFASRGEVVFVSPEIDPVNGDIRVMIEIQNPEGTFRPGMLGDLHIFK